MTVLSWRDVATPDMRGIQDGFGAAADLFTSGMGALRGTVKDMKASKVDSQSTALLSELAAIQDPAEVEKQMPSILAKYDPRYIDQDALATAMGRPGALLKQAADKSTYLESQKLIKDSDFIRSNAGLINQFKNTPAGPARDEMLLKHKDVFDQMHPRAFQDMLEDRLTINQRELGNFGTAISNLSSEANYRDGRQDRGESRGMEQLKSELSVLADHGARQRFMNNQANYDRIAKDPNYGPQVAARMRGLLNGDISEGGGAGGGGGAAAGLGGFGAGDDYDQFVVALESGGDANARAGTSSATGLHQFTEDTWIGTVNKAQPAWAKGLSRDQILAQRTNPQRSSEMEKVLRAGNVEALNAAGIPVNNASMYAMHHFAPDTAKRFLTASGDTPVSQIFSAAEIKANPYLQKAGTRDGVLGNWAERTKGLSSTQAREAGIVTETAIDASIGGSQITDTIRTIRESGAMTDSSTNKAIAMLAAAGEIDPVTKQPIAGGVFKGNDVNRLTEKIVEVKNRAFKQTGKKISAKAAIMILERSVDGEQGAVTRGFDTVGNFLGISDGMSENFNDSYIDNAIGLLLDPKKAGRVGVDLDRAAQARGKPSQAAALLAQIDADEQKAIADARKTGQTVDFQFYADQRAAVEKQAGGLVDAGGKEAVRQVASKFPAEAPPPNAPNNPARQAPPPADQLASAARGGGIRLPRETEAVREQAMYAMANQASQASFKQKYGITPQQFLANLRFQVERRRPVATKPAVAPASPPADIAKFNQLLAASSGNMLVKR